LSLKLLLDQGLPRSAAAQLRGLGFDAVHAGDIGMATAADRDLLEHARQDGRTVVTLDADFHTLLALSNAVSPSVVRLRLEGLRGYEIASLMKRVIASCEADLRSGAMVTVDETRIRVRRLPLIANDQA